MESEEYEHIPWANLVADAQPMIDRRLYVVGGVVAVIVAVFLIARMSTPGVAQPPAATSALEAPDLTPVDSDPMPDSTVPESPIVVTEADLMAGVEPVPAIADPLAVMVAEWFVTDFFTLDGSAATLASLEALMAPGASAELPHHNHTGPDQFVEWATVFASEASTDGERFSVAFRTVHATDEGFVRDPVRAVAVDLSLGSDGWVVTGIPTMIDAP